MKPKPQNIHKMLGPAFYDEVEAAHFPEYKLRYRNDVAAAAIGLNDLSDADFIRHFGYFVPFEGSLEKPLALRYHGHQFGVYNPDIGDGRGFLFAQFTEKNTGRLLDLGTKGSGRTPYARTADGRLTLKGAVREILATEMLTALNVPTSSSFCVIETGENLIRQDEPSPTRSAVLVRLLHSHIRIGSFQRLAYLGQQDNIEKLLRHVVSHYYPQIDVKVPIDRLIISFLEQFSQKVGVMVAGWMAAGFVHGVLNTDNFNITGESFDYGPWRFLPAMDTSFTAAYFDQQSRYAYGRQPEAALWALCRLADCFLPFISAERLGEALSDFYPALETEIAKAVFWRLGLQPVQIETAIQITPKLFKAATQSQIGWDLLFKELYAGYLDSPNASALWHSEAGLRDLAAELGQLCDCGSVLVRQQDKKAISEIKSKPLVTLEISAMESLWTPIAENDDWQDFNDYLQAIRAHGKALHRP